jgi:hypothetical protein
MASVPVSIAESARGCNQVWHQPVVCMFVKPVILIADWLPGGRLASGNLHELAGASATRATYL